ncbi:nuclear transport factor 2 family protein [Nocardia vaccinii]|uniref:nuclear transport factor 2 family protein n=1 Tax=Nocardia vaccinii TaxID=1822 RepID=UPI000836D8F9|nr:nuclear transport factor 2 family protein [Nocardia vaccinii]
MSTNAELSHQLTDAINAHDVPAIEALFAADSVFKPAQAGVEITGREDVAKALVAWLDKHSTYRLETIREFFVGDTGYNEWRFVAKTVTGEDIETHGVDYFRFAGGKIVEKDSFRKI